MITRFALFAASLAAALVLAAGVVLVTAPAPAADVMVDAAAQTTPAPVIQVDTVYVTPEPATPEVTQEPAVPQEPAPVAVSGGEHEDEDHESQEHEGEDD